ncbi:MAG TPA: nicotinamide mononucleotide transporter [Candidatus Brocadiia bacterium]|nr:nicotinamide mononucleotide transporter [Candidatus Brocadiia bacterium]
MHDAYMWPAVLLSLAGTVANIQRKRWSFLCWIVANAAWAAYNVSLRIWSQATLMTVYLLLSVWGWYSWRTGPMRARAKAAQDPPPAGSTR